VHGNSLLLWISIFGVSRNFPNLHQQLDVPTTMNLGSNRILRRTVLCKYALVVLFIAACVPLLAQQALIDDLPDDPRVRIVERRYHHDSLGTGFVAEIDLGSLPAWKGDLEIKAVKWPIPVTEVTHGDKIEPGQIKNPIAALGYGLAKLFTLGGPHHKYELPLPPQEVYPLDEGCESIYDGRMKVESLPKNKRLRIFIPHALVNDSARVYFMLKAEQFFAPVKYFYTEQLFPDTLLPDLKVQTLRTTSTRYAGAAGRMVTVHYSFPKYLLLFNSKYDGMVPSLTLNGKYPIPQPADYPRSWSFVTAASGELRFFLPDALMGPEGKAFVEVSFKDRDSPRIGYQRLEFEGEKVEGPQVGLRILEVEQKKPKWRDGCYLTYRIQLGIGGISIWESGIASDTLGDKTHLRWKDCPEISFSTNLQDTVVTRVRHESEKFYGYPQCIFYMPVEQFTKTKGISKYPTNFATENNQFRWILFVEYFRK
jgi:hypothetical protein